MTYLKHESRKGASTILISARIPQHTIEFADKECFVFGRFINAALETFIHDLQTDHEVTGIKARLGGRYAMNGGYDNDWRGSATKMIRVRTDFIDYLKFNQYKVNTAINMACDRWRRYYENGNVAGYKIRKIINRRKEDAREREEQDKKAAQE